MPELPRASASLSPLASIPSQPPSCSEGASAPSPLREASQVLLPQILLQSAQVPGWKLCYSVTGEPSRWKQMLERANSNLKAHEPK